MKNDKKDKLRDKEAAFSASRLGQVGSPLGKDRRLACLLDQKKDYSIEQAKEEIQQLKRKKVKE